MLCSILWHLLAWIGDYLSEGEVCCDLGKVFP